MSNLLINLNQGKNTVPKLISIGCSYTEHYLDSMHTKIKLDFPRWPEHLSDKLDMEYVNLGRTGMGNEYMVSQLLETLMRVKEIGLVVIMWSEWQRMDFQIESNSWYSLHPHRDNEEIEKFPMNREGRIALLQYFNVVASVMKNLRQFLIAQKLLNDVPYLMIQGCCPLVEPMYLHPENNSIDWEEITRIRKEAIKQMLDSPIVDKIKEDKFIGWPIFREIGGFTVDNMLDKIDTKREKLRVSPDDSHPNSEGHEIIAKNIYEQYKKVYK